MRKSIINTKENRSRVFDALIQACLIFLLIFTPLALGTVQAWSIFVMRVAVIVGLVSWFLRMIGQGQITVRRTPIDIPVLVFLGVATVSALRSPYRRLSMEWLANLATYVAIYFLVTNNLRNNRNIKRLVTAMFFAATIAGVYGLLRYFNILDILPHSQDPRISSTYYNPNHYAGFLILVTPLSLSFFLFSKTYLRSLAFAVLSAVLVANLALSFSMTNLAFLISMLLLIIVVLRFRELRTATRRLLTALPLFLLLYFFILSLTRPIFPRYDITATTRFGQVKETLVGAVSERIGEWRDELPVFLDRPYLGWGLGTFSEMFPRYRPLDPHWAFFRSYAHSDYLQIASDMGIVGLGSYLILVGVIVGGSIRLLRQTQNPYRVLSLGVTVALFAAIIRSFWDNNLFVIQSLSIYFFTLVGILQAMRKMGDSES